MVTDETKIVAERIAAARGDITAVELSRQAAVARSTLERKLDTGDFLISDLVRVARVIGVKASDLLKDLPGDAA